jgi:glycosyltransferase involved in cell wall biosynthesis
VLIDGDALSTAHRFILRDTVEFTDEIHFSFGLNWIEFKLVIYWLGRKNMKTIAIIPAYNEEIGIGSIILNVQRYVDHVLVVDDGSNDSTADIAELAGAEVIRHHQNQGKGAALKTGFSRVGGYDAVVTIDADGQHNPQEIPKLLEPIIKGEADLVNGSRYIEGGEKNTPKYRRVGQSVLDIATNMNGKLNVTDSQSGFRAFSISTIPAFRFNLSGFGIESEMLTDASNAGFRIGEVQIGVRYDTDTKRNPIKHGVGVLVRIIQDMEFNRPLYFFTVPGIILIIIGLASGLIFFGDYLGGTRATLGPTVFAALIAVMGVFIAFTGIILDTVSRLIKEALSK